MTTGTIQEQPREVNGRWGSKHNTPPGGSLVDSVDGSFLFPPSTFRNAEELATFFRTQPISDQVLSNARHAYRYWRAEQIRAKVRAAIADWRNSSEAIQKAREGGTAGLAAATEQKSEQFKAMFEDHHPIRELPYSGTRAILIAYRTATMRGILNDEEEKQKALNAPIVFNGETITADALCERFNAYDWAPRALTDSDLAAIDASNRVAQILAHAHDIYGVDYVD